MQIKPFGPKVPCSVDGVQFAPVWSCCRQLRWGWPPVHLEWSCCWQEEAVSSYSLLGLENSVLQLRKIKSKSNEPVGQTLTLSDREGLTLVWLDMYMQFDVSIKTCPHWLGPWLLIHGPLVGSTRGAWQPKTVNLQFSTWLSWMGIT